MGGNGLPVEEVLFCGLGTVMAGVLCSRFAAVMAETLPSSTPDHATPSALSARSDVPARRLDVHAGGRPTDNRTNPPTRSGWGARRTYRDPPWARQRWTRGLLCSQKVPRQG